MNFLQSNYLMDVVMPALPPNAFKVVCAVARKSWGWGKDSIDLPYSKLMELTGISSHNTLRKAIGEAVEAGYLSQSDWANTSIYAVVMKQKVSVSDTDYAKEGVSETDSTMSEVDAVLCQKLTQKVSETDTHINNIKNRKINIYAHAQDDVANMIATLTQHVKDRYSLTDNTKWEDAAFELIGREATAEQLAAFGQWWAVNGYYKGKPAIKSVLNEWENFKAGVVVEPKGNKQELADAVWRVVCQTGRTRYAEAKERLNGEWAYIEAMGKWSHICGMTEDVFKVKFFEAINRVKNGKQQITA